MSDDARSLKDTLDLLNRRGALATDVTIPVDSPTGASTVPTGLTTLRPEALPRLDIQPSGDEAEFTLLNEIGRGGMGVVHLVRQRSLQRFVVAKRLHPEAANAWALLREALYSGTLEHPNIIPVHTVGTDDQGAPLFVMKRVDGTSWQQLLDDPEHERWAQLHTDRLSFNLDVISQLCNALSYAHSHNIIHRDIKPDNVMIGRFGEVYLLDWGVALDLGTAGARAPELAGTPIFMAPEMLTERLGALSFATDVFLLGATLHYALTGRPRHAGDSLTAVIANALMAEPWTYDASIPAPLAAICNKACARAPADRYASVAELQRALEGFLQNRASVELAQAARSRLKELEQRLDRGGSRPEELYRLLNECRFGFEQALQRWPDNADAREGLQTALRRVIRHELEARNLSTAKALAAELTPLPEELRVELDALEAAISAERAQAATDRQLAHELDLAVGSRHRAIAAILLASVIATSLAIFVVGSRMGLFDLNYGMVLLGPCILLTLVLIGALVWRRTLLRTHINRRIAATVAIMGLCLLFNRAVGYQLSHPLGHTILHDGVILLAIALLAGLTIHRVYWIGAAITAIGVCVIMLLPETLPLGALPFFLLGLASAVGGTLWLNKRYGREEPAALSAAGSSETE